MNLKFQILFMLTISVFSAKTFAQDVEQAANIFGKLPEISGAEISPDGTKIIFMQNYQGRKILVTKSLTDPTAPPTEFLIQMAK